jgi:hypothetical protein
MCLFSGILPALILTIFLGIFGLYTAILLINFKLNHPGVHNMGIQNNQKYFQRLALKYYAGDAGYILFGSIAREILSAGTIIFAVFGAVSAHPVTADQASVANIAFRVPSYSLASRHCQRSPITVYVRYIWL